MTLALLSPEDTGDLTPFRLFPPPLRRPPALPPRPDETLILPEFAPPPPPRIAVPAVYGRKPVEVVKKFFRRGRHRMTWRMRLAAALVGSTR